MACSFETRGVAPDQVADAHGKARGLGRLEDATEEGGVHAGTADVVEEGGDLQLSQLLTGNAEATSDEEDHLRGACRVGLVVARYDLPGVFGVRHVIQREEGCAVDGCGPVPVCHSVVKSEHASFVRGGHFARTCSACCSCVPSAVSQWIRGSVGLNQAYWRRARRWCAVFICLQASSKEMPPARFWASSR